MVDVDYKNGEVTMHCEHVPCYARFDFKGKQVDWSEVTLRARGLGWKVFNRNGTWHHFCPIHAGLHIKEKT